MENIKNGFEPRSPFSSSSLITYGINQKNLTQKILIFENYPEAAAILRQKIDLYDMDGKNEQVKESTWVLQKYKSFHVGDKWLQMRWGISGSSSGIFVACDNQAMASAIHTHIRES